MPGGAVLTGPGIGANAPRSNLVGIVMCCFAAFGGILFGYDTGTINGITATKDWLRTFGQPTSDLKDNPTGYYITSSQHSLVVSILSAGTFFGALAASPIGDIAGRKWGIIIATIVFDIGIAMQTASTSMALFVTGRVFAGLGVGLVSVLVPMYQSECAPKWIRGAVVSGYQLAITLGILLAAIISNATKDRDNHSAYRILIAVQFVWSSILTVGMLFLPETPRWLIKRGRVEDAARSLSILTSVPSTDPELQSEIKEIRASLAEEEKLGESSYVDCFRSSSNKIRLRTLSGISIQAWQQLTGINFIFYYGTTVFQNAGIANPFLISIATDVVNMFMTLPGMWAIEKIGRRRLLLIGAVGMCICEYIIAIVGVSVSTENTSGQKVLVAFSCIYIAFFAATWGPIAWVIIGEIFPLQVRAKGMSLSAASNWLWNFGIAYATPYLIDSGPGNAGLGLKVFFIWGTTCFGCIIFTYFCIPETKGLSLEQVDLLYMNSTPRTSVRYRDELVAKNIHVSIDGGHLDTVYEDKEGEFDEKV